MTDLRRTFELHLDAFKDTYGLSSPLAVLTDVLTTTIGALVWLLVNGPIKWIGLLVGVGSAIGLAVRLAREVRD